MNSSKESGGNLSVRYGRWALVTGAAVGLGAEFGRQLAAQNMSLVLVDIDREALGRQAEALREQFSVEVCELVVDLSEPDFIDKITDAIEGKPIALLINNAGVARLGEFLPQAATFLQKQIDVNIRAVMLLTHYFGQEMVARGKGGIIILSSMAAMNGGAFNANYSATKAYDLVLAESLWAEWQKKGVDVLGFMPWKTATPGYFKESTNDGASDVLGVEETVTQALNLLGKQPSGSVGKNAVVAQFFARLLSRKAMIKAASAELRTMLSK